MTLEDAVSGDRDELAHILDGAPGDKVTKLTALLRAPEYANVDLAKLASLSKMTAFEVLDAFRHGSLAHATLAAASEMARKLPQVVSDTFADSLNQTVLCVKCDGTGQTDDKRCSACRGEGTIILRGSVDNRKIALEMAGMTGKHAGGISINTQVNVSAPPPSLEDQFRQVTVEVEEDDY